MRKTGQRSLKRSKAEVRPLSPFLLPFFFQSAHTPSTTRSRRSKNARQAYLGRRDSTVRAPLPCRRPAYARREHHYSAARCGHRRRPVVERRGLLRSRGASLSLSCCVLSSPSTDLFSPKVAPDENDGQKLFDRIQALGPDNFLTAIRDVEGPYALVFYQASSGRVYFARDPLGRRSLLLQRPTSSNPTFSLVSCPPGNNSTLRGLEEVTCDAVHCYDLLKEGELSPVRLVFRFLSHPV